ncbi:chromate transporter [Rhodoferax sp.]|uniref:chromate transporter n=1 Tax=Rhodoferax sp. TaxID=50421 RepID=UPI00260138AB|nr:chromate transporter [Rhodoferax sp.]
MSSLPSAPPSSAPASALHQPQSPTDLFMSFTWLALQGFGGVLGVVQRELVERKRWMTNEEFLEDWAVAQIMPGPNVLNLGVMIGDRHFGLRGALAASAGLLAVPLLVVLALALAYAQYADHPAVGGALRGMGAVAAGLICATGLRLLRAVRRHVMGIALCAVLGVLTFVPIALLHWPLIYVLLSIGGAACVQTYRKLAP